MTAEDSAGSAAISDDLEMEANPLLANNSNTNNETDIGANSNEAFFIYGHMALSLLFLMAGSSIVPLFAAAEDESWRTHNIPYQKTAAGDILVDFRLNQPLIDPPTISSSSLIVTCIVLPLALILSLNLASRRPMGRPQFHELRAGVCALLVSVGLSESVTCTLKLYVSRHRPNFYHLCGFNPQTLQCEAELSKVHEASLSFPSGHSSLSFCGMTFLVYFALGRLALLTASNSSWTILGGRTILLYPYKSLLGVLCVLVPWSYCFFVAASRIVDYWHHPSDVVAGSLIGIAAATIGYHAFYPASHFGVGTTATGIKAGVPLSLQQY
jgi:membrane-associated phospholipid phosphatase